ncbi:hypothetical protein ACIBQ1_58295 [Nonomuraea sp. NPDC050153]|uniref:hypothetical protein n=1 Tax=Nonomuraea sp. NPDC050153 TaxID=3364359 RepID=UPI003795B078
MVGTGGDKADTVTISTVAAAPGARIVKHGNRSMSSADLWAPVVAGHPRGDGPARDAGSTLGILAGPRGPVLLPAGGGTHRCHPRPSRSGWVPASYGPLAPPVVSSNSATTTRPPNRRKWPVWSGGLLALVGMLT